MGNRWFSLLLLLPEVDYIDGRLWRAKRAKIAHQYRTVHPDLVLLRADSSHQDMNAP
jgi:hypothetical protein